MIPDMRVVAAIALAVFGIGAGLTWATDWVVVGADGDTIGAILMIAGGAGLFGVIVLSASRNPGMRGDGPESSEPVDEPDDHLTTGWPRR